MATYHLSVKIGKVGTGKSHADYIARDGKYATKDKDDLEVVESLNMPAWVNTTETVNSFWQSADEFERANGSVYREIEVALPRELTPEQRQALVREFIQTEIGDRHATTYAIHNPKAAIEGGEQPHAHIMYSERTHDGIERSREQYFKRYNAKKPEQGGCKKANTEATREERKARLVGRRERWATLQNTHLAKHGHAARVTHLSLEAQGITRDVEPHLGPWQAKELAEAVRIDRERPKVDTRSLCAIIAARDNKEPYNEEERTLLRMLVATVKLAVSKDFAFTIEGKKYTRAHTMEAILAKKLDEAYEGGAAVQSRTRKTFIEEQTKALVTQIVRAPRSMGMER